MCARCPVAAACLVFALQALPEGIAGGTTPEERREFAHRGPQIGRPFDGRRFELDQPGRDPAAGTSGAEMRATGRVALRAGRPARAVARDCGVTERTALRWAQQVRTQDHRAR